MATEHDKLRGLYYAVAHNLPAVEDMLFKAGRTNSVQDEDRTAVRAALEAVAARARDEFAQDLRQAATCCGKVVHHPDTYQLASLCEIMDRVDPSA